MTFKVGDKVWVFNINRRVYPRDEQNKTTGGPIYAEHFEQVEIVGETTKSWLIGWREEKINKKDPKGIFTDQQKEDAIWVNYYRYKITDKVRRCSDASILQEIAKLVGFEVTK